MKAKIKSLGSVVDLSEYVYDEDGNEYTWDEVELIDDDKWQQVRIQFVGQISSSIMSDCEFYAQGIVDECKMSGKSYLEVISQMSLELADALIEELKKEEK